MTPLLDIEEYSICGNLIKVLPADENKKMIALDKPSFEHWADANFKREYGDNFGESGQATWEQYYASEWIEADLKEYIAYVNEVTAAMRKFDEVLELVKA
jgi:hypothetical protein